MILFTPAFTVSAKAVEFHEDPATADTVFSAINLIRNYSNTFAYVLSLKPKSVNSELVKLEFANIPENNEFQIDVIFVSGNELSKLGYNIDSSTSIQQQYLREFRLITHYKIRRTDIQRILRIRGKGIDKLDQSHGGKRGKSGYPRL